MCLPPKSDGSRCLLDFVKAFTFREQIFYDQLSDEEKWNPKTRTGTYNLASDSLEARLKVPGVGQEFMLMLLETYDSTFRIGGKLFKESKDPDANLSMPARYESPEVMRMAGEKTQQRESTFVQFKLFCQESRHVKYTGNATDSCRAGVLQHLWKSFEISMEDDPVKKLKTAQKGKEGLMNMLASEWYSGSYHLTSMPEDFDKPTILRAEDGSILPHRSILKTLSDVGMRAGHEAQKFKLPTRPYVHEFPPSTVRWLAKGTPVMRPS